MSWPPQWSSLNIDPDRHLTYDEYQAKYGHQEEESCEPES